MLEYNMTKNILLIAFLIFEFLRCTKTHLNVQYFSNKLNLTNLNLKF